MNEVSSGFDLLGAEAHVEQPRVHITWTRSILALGAAVLAAATFRKHPVLAAMDAAALVANTHALASGDRTWREAARRMGLHVVATAGSLALPSYPAVGWVAGAVAADLLIDGEGGGILEEWAHHAGVDDVRVAQAVEVKPDNTTTALVKT